MDAVETGATLVVRPISIEDAERCGHVAFAAHQAAARRLGIPSEQPSAEFATGLIKGKIADPNARGLVAESAGEIVGSVFLNRFPPAGVAAVGPLTADPEGPAGVGARLLSALLADVSPAELPSIRLVQSPSHFHSLALYAKTGFVLREP
ncbi:MAG: GNAT family N-acetyltransferase, partial [Pseudomonadota bacterium]|nr:GNAT family N-acetyltransferase [Pseudomonadota bacterium]